MSATGEHYEPDTFVVDGQTADKGYSVKNTDRPRFQELIRDIESGLVRKVIVY